MIPPSVRPALLRGRRVDFWPGALWQRCRPHSRPAGGWWQEAGGGPPLAALDGDQSLEAMAAAGAIVLRLDCARAAEAGCPVPWTRRLKPIPPRRARAIISSNGSQDGAF